MSSPTSFGSQVSAIMDVLAKAAVAEITKLVEDGTVVLRLEMRRRDGEIQELKRRLKLMEAELCKAKEAAMTRAAVDEQEQTAAGNQVPPKDEEDQKMCAAYSPKAAEPLCDEPGRGTVESRDVRPSVKDELADELSVRETADDTTTATATAAAAAAAAAAAVAANACFGAGERDDPIWPLAPCRVFEKGSVAMHVFPSRAEQYSARRDAGDSFKCSSAAAEEIADDSSSVPIKVEVVVRPTCMAGAATGPVHNAPFRHVSCPAVGQDSLQQAGPSLALAGPAPAPSAEVLGRNNLRTKRLLNMWRTNQKLFVCPACNKGFPRLSQLEEHKAAHQPFKPFRCLKCGKSFTQKTRLKTHQSVHTGEKPFSCKICGKMFSRQDNCLRHERFHSGLKPYSCGQCGKSFTVLGNLRIHQEIHLQGR